jgi:glyoxylase-like metal-dependent hydrolase (beta-lactamase superfamily II)
MDQSSDCVVVDPGLEPEEILAQLKALCLSPVAILNTHGHSDHIGGNQAIKTRWPDCPIIIGREEAQKLTDSQLNLSAPFGMPMTSPPADRLVDDGDTISLAGMDFLVRHIPGHSAGHVVYIYNNHQPPLVFAGDVIFAGSVGRTDFPDGDFDALAANIRAKLFILPDATILLPGHGPTTTVGREKRHNPFVRGM